MDPAKMKVVDLRSELGALGLDTKGNKPALVERLKKALESKTGKAIVDTTILDTSTEDADEPPTPRRAGPASRTTRRSSSSRLAAATPVKQIREKSPEPIEEEVKSEEPEREQSPPPAATPVPVPVPKPESEPEQPVEEPTPAVEAPAPSDIYSIDDERSQSPVPVKEEEEEPMEVQESAADPVVSEESSEKEKEDEVEMKTEPEEASAEKEPENKDTDDKDAKDDKKDVFDSEAQENEQQNKNKQLTEEEEWQELNERLKAREQERIEREKKQAEDDAKRMEEVSQDPVKFGRLKRRQEKKQRWSNFYKSVEVTNEVLTPPAESELLKGKKEATEQKIAEPELNDEKISLSWYDSDLNQYLELPELSSVIPLSDGMFAHAWAGARASHGVKEGRVCYEVRVGESVTTADMTDKETAAGLRIGWSTDDSTLHLGDGETSWGYESSGRAVHNGEFKEYAVKLQDKDIVGVYLDLESSPCTISFTVNGEAHGTAFEFSREAIGEKPLYPHLLTKNMCYAVNFGQYKYNMLTKTKIVRKRLEIPVEEVIEQKRKIEAEIQRQKEEAAQREKERREKEKKEREERQRKKKEEREEKERERKEREKAKAEQEKKERGEGDGDEKDKDEDVKMEADDGEKETENGAEAEGTEDSSAPKENGEKEKEPEEATPSESAEPAEPAEPAESVKPAEPTESAEPAEPAVKDEPMDTAAPAESAAEPTADSGDVKPEPEDDSEVVEVTEEQVLQGHVLDKRIKFVIRHVAEQELDGEEVPLVEGYVLIAGASLLPGPRRPASLADCEVILMVGMPGSGKTHWVREHVLANPDKRYNILSTGALFDRMKVDCKPFRAAYEGRWDAMVSKCAKSVLRLLELAKGRRRNFILDQTNVYPSAQRRKLREFEGYRRVGVVVVPDEETSRERTRRREEADGKEVPDGAIVDMKANFSLPEKGSWLDEVIYPELDAEQAKAVVEGFHKEARAAGVHREREKRDRSPMGGRDQPANKRSRDDRRHRDDRRQGGRDFNRDREDRWGGGGGGGGGRWGGGGGGGGLGRGGGGSRWGSRERSGGPPQPPPGRFERGGGGGGWGPPGGRNDFGRERDDFRGGRGGRGGPGGHGGPGGRGGGPGGRGRGERGGSGGPPERFRGPDRNQRPPHQDKRPPNAPGGGGQGSWQRGGQAPGRGAQRGGMQRQGPGPLNQKDGQNQNQQNQQQNQQGWNQWAGGWGGWGNWNQQQAGWGNWGNWGNWNQNAAGAGAAAGAQGAGAQGAAGAQGKAAQQWGGYTPQQWYQWQQWQQQQQQQGWPGQYQQQQQQGQQATGNAAAEQAWAQYYQNYGGGNANAASADADKK